MHEIKEYQLDENFTLITEKKHESITVPRVVRNRQNDEMQKQKVASYKEYTSFKSLNYDDESLIFDNLFDLIEMIEIIKIFIKNNLDERILHLINDLEFKLNKETTPYSLLIEREDKVITLSRFECTKLVAKLNKLLYSLEPVPHNIINK